MPEQKPSVGRIVHFKVGENVVRPAIITQVWNDDCLNLAVFPDGTNDGVAVEWPNRSLCGLDGGYMGAWWITSVMRGQGVRQWDWPKKV